MKKIIYFIVLVIFIIPFNIYAIDLDINSKNAILYNLNDDSILYEKNSDEKVSIASLTKIMTAIVAIENINNLDDKIKITYDDLRGLAEENASVCGLRIGEEVTYRDLLYGLLLPSGADAAQALCRNIAGSNEKFVELMNKKASELGLQSTHFVNSTGLDIDNHYSTVKEVATIFKYAIKNNDFLEIIKNSSYTTSNGNHTFKSTIKKATDAYNLDMKYLIGGKTGTTGDAGLCLSTIAEYNKVKYMLVTVRAPYSRTTPYNYLDAKTIYEYFMNNYSYKNVIDKGDVLVTLPTQYAKEDEVVFTSNNKLDMYLDNNYSKDKLEYIYTGKKLITLDMNEGEKIGKVDIKYDNKLLLSADIYLKEKQQLDIGKYLSANKIIIIIPSVIIFLLLLLIIVLKRHKRLQKKKK